MTEKKLFCFGYGYTSGFLARAIEELPGWASSSGTTRDMTKRAALRARGVEAHIFDIDKPLGDPLQMMAGATHVLVSTPSDPEGDMVFRSHAEDFLALPKLEWVGYLSTTAVYGNRDGAWVDEKSEIRPSTIRGTRRAIAEKQWLSLFRSAGLPVHLFRLSGIYGPGRSAIDSVRAGIARRINKPGHTFSRIHIEDVVQTILASFEAPRPGGIYNVADDEAAPSHEVIAYAARLLGREPPPMVRFEEANLAPITLSFYSDNKRIKNDLMKTELGVVLKCPNYRVGLEECLEAERVYTTRGERPPWAAETEEGSGDRLGRQNSSIAKGE